MYCYYVLTWSHFQSQLHSLINLSSYQHTGFYHEGVPQQWPPIRQRDQKVQLNIHVPFEQNMSGTCTWALSGTCTWGLFTVWSKKVAITAQQSLWWKKMRYSMQCTCTCTYPLTGTDCLLASTVMARNLSKLSSIEQLMFFLNLQENTYMYFTHTRAHARTHTHTHTHTHTPGMG